MMKKLLLSLMLLVTPLQAQNGLDKIIPSQPTNFVTDAANLFSDAEEAKMNEIALSTQKRLGGDIAVLTLPDIGDYQPYEVAMTAGRTWKVGGRGPIGSDQRNLGVVVLVVPRTSAHKGECFIATGMGVEGFITDSRAGDICGDNIPLFKAGNYGEATTNIVSTVSNIMDKHVNPPPPPPPFEFPWTGFWVVVIIGMFGFMIWYYYDQKRQIEERERERIQREIWKKEEARRAEERRLAAIEAEKRRKEAEERERIRWNSLTPEQQAAELAERERQRIIAEEARKKREAEEAERRKKRQQEEEENRRRRSSYSSYNSYGSSGYSSGGSSFGGFGGGGGFSGGGGGRSF